jgi:hypothetical protein
VKLNLSSTFSVPHPGSQVVRGLTQSIAVLLLHPDFRVRALDSLIDPLLTRVSKQKVQSLAPQKCTPGPVRAELEDLTPHATPKNKTLFWA